MQNLIHQQLTFELKKPKHQNNPLAYKGLEINANVIIYSAKGESALI